MKAFLIMVLALALGGLQAMAQTVTCSSCGGYGGMSTMAGWMSCFTCGGTGRMADPAAANQRAYEWGASLVEEYEKKRDKNPVNVYNDGVEALAKFKYDKAYERFYKAAAEQGYVDAYYYLAACYELGIGCTASDNSALRYYRRGASAGCKNCKVRLQQIASNGTYAASDKNRRAFCTNIAQLWYAAGSAASNFMNGGGSSSSSSGGSSYGCSGCGGTGHCTACSGTGSIVIETGYYTGNSRKKVTNCAACNGTGRCGVCRGSGSVR